MLAVSVMFGLPATGLIVFQYVKYPLHNYLLPVSGIYPGNMESSTKKIILTLSITLTALSILLAGAIFLVHELSKETYSARVMDRFDGSPVQGALVEVDKVTYDDFFYPQDSMIPSTKSHVKTVHTDENGRFSVTLPGINEDRGYYHFRISAEGHVPDNVPAYEYPGNGYSYHYSDDLESIIFMNSVCILNGNVTGADGIPIPGATVLFRPDVINFHSEGVDQAARSDADGRYSMEYVRAGTGTIEVCAPHHEKRTVSSVTLNLGTNTVDIVLKKDDTIIPRVYGTISPEGRHFEIDDSRILLIFTETPDQIQSGERFFTLVRDWTYLVHLGPGSYSLRGVYVDLLPQGGWFEVYSEDHRFGGLEVEEDMELDLNAFISYVMV